MNFVNTFLRATLYDNIWIDSCIKTHNMYALKANMSMIMQQIITHEIYSSSLMLYCNFAKLYF